MNSLIILATLLATTPHYDVTYQVITNDLIDYTAYSFHGNKILTTPQRDIYVLAMTACELRESFADIIDETLFLPSKKIRKSSFFLEKDYIDNRCLLIVIKHPYSKNIIHTYMYDYWIPKYNSIIMLPGAKYPHRHPPLKKYFPKRKIKKAYIYYNKLSNRKLKKKKHKKRHRKH